jgi:eukaryotic-like serine/threonine-protein kinase
VKILDFGLARVDLPRSLETSATVPTPTQSGTVMGTVGYMAPEQLRGQALDHRADLFSLGAVLYEMLSGRRAFAATSAADTIGAILDREPPDLPVAERRIPPGLARIVDRCLEKNPSARFQTAADLAFALEALSGSTASTKVEAPGGARTAAVVAPRRVGVTAALSCAATLIVGIPVALYLQPRPPAPLVTRLDVVTPPTSDAFSFALSPDGRQVVFVANGDGGPQLWLRRLDDVAAQPLAGTTGASYPFWAPDGRAVAFFADAKLKRINLSGGAPQIVADAPQGRGGAWNDDDLIVFAPGGLGTLVSVAANGGAPMPLTRVSEGESGHRWPQFLPDGRILFFVSSGQVDKQGVYVAALDGREPVRVLPADTAAQYAEPGYLLRVSQGALIAQSFDATGARVTGEPIAVAQGVGQDDGTWRSAFSVSPTGILAHRTGAPAGRRLVWVSRTGAVQSSLALPDQGAQAPANPALAPDAKRVAIQRVVQGNIDIWLMDVARGVATRFTFDTANDARPVWSPDGIRVVFASSRSKGVQDLFEKPASGATDEQLFLATPDNKVPLDWSLDGRFLLYSSQGADTQSDLWVFPVTGERKPSPIVQTRFDEIEGQFSPDGHWIAYASNESGRYEIYVQSFPEPGGKFQVSTTGGAHPRWRPDGRELFYVALDNRLMAVPVRVTGQQRTFNAGAPSALFTTRLVTTGANIAAGGSNARAQYVVAPDGRFLMNVATDDATSAPITIVLNWAAGLTK